MPRAASTCLILALGALSGMASAQTDSAAAATPELAPVQVTGSRLRGTVGNAAAPLITLDRQDLEASGQLRLGDILQRLPLAGGAPLNTRTTERGAGGELARGIETVELRGLGEERTLILLNGRRIVPGGNGAGSLVDLGMLPLALIERVEIYASGASIEYGADAVAGVINILTRDTVEGIELSAQGGISSRGDAENFALRAVTGRRGARGGFVAGIDYSDQQPVSKGDRAFSFARLSFDGPDNRLVFEGSSAPPGGNYRTSAGRLTLIDGRDGTSVEDFRPFTDADRFNFNPFEDLVQASERTGLFAHGDWQASPGLRLGVETLWHRRESSQQLVALPFFSNRLADVVVAADQLYNPFGEALADVRRRLVEAGPRRFAQDSVTWRAVLYADGQIDAGGGIWSWDAALNHGRTETDQRQTGDLLADRVRLALGPSFRDADGRAVCGRPSAPLPGCVPLNLFGPVGSITPEMLDYVAADLRDAGNNRQTVFTANLTGEPLTLPAGPLALAVGFEWRRERGAERPDAESQAGNTTGKARAATAGSFESRELYVEFGLPLLAGRRFAERLDLEFGGRRVDFDNFGSRTLFDLRLAWQPHPALGFSAQRTEAFRAPGIGELFGGLRQANPIVLDPCADFASLEAIEIERCVAQGVPADGSFTQNGAEIPELGGGNPALEPELAEVHSLGLAWRPGGASASLLRLSYYDIEIRDAIASLGAQTVLQQCLATGAAVFCDAIERADDGQIEFIEARLQNIARERARGLDLEADWQHRLVVGRMRHRALISRVLERALVAFPGAASLFAEGEFDPDRFGAVPLWRASYDVEWSGERWALGYRASWIDRLDERGGEVFPGTVHRVGAVLYHDLRAAWQATDRLRIEGGIDNLSDVQPPLLVNADEANTDLSTYRALGRSYWLRIRARL